MAQLGSLDMTIAFPVQIAMEFRGKHRFTIDIDNGGVSSNGTRNWVKAEMLTGVSGTIRLPKRHAYASNSQWPRYASKA